MIEIMDGEEQWPGRGGGDTQIMFGIICATQVSKMGSTEPFFDLKLRSWEQIFAKICVL